MKKVARVFTEKEFNTASRVEKCYIHLVEPSRFPLNDLDADYLDNLRKVWAVMDEHDTQRERVKFVSQVVPVCERTAVKYMSDAIFLFGDLLKVDAGYELALMYDRYTKLYRNALDIDDLETARRCLDSATKILAALESRQPAEPRRYEAILFTDDPQFLTSRLDGLAEAIDYENVESTANLLEPAAVAILAE